MANYMKSEFYRIFHDKTIYLITLITTALAVLYNVVHYLALTWLTAFPYGNVRFVLSMLITGMQIFYTGALLVVMLLSTNEYRNGILKNAVASGMSRVQIFVGKCVVYGSVATLSAAVILTGFISTAYALLGWNPAVPLESVWPLQVLLTGAAANLPFSLASVVLTVALCQMFQKESQVYIIWVLIICVIPMSVQILGLKIPLLARIAQWMPWNYMKTQVSVSFLNRQMDALWMHPDGFLKCVAAGAAGIIIFGAAGILGFRKKDID